MPLALLLALPLAAATAEAAPVCPATPTPPPAGLSGWASPTAAVAGAKAMLPLDHRAAVTLAPSASVTFVAPPARPAAATTFGGVIAFRVGSVGTYRVALGTGAWIDVLRDGKPVSSTAHAHGPACSGIRKIVDFALMPGDHVLQISGSRDRVAAVLITPAR